MANSKYTKIILNRSLLTRLFSKIKISTVNFYKGVPCWEWTTFKHPNGYAKFTIKAGSKCFQTHRLFYELFVENISDELVCDHLCKNPPCVNPIHIEPVTQKVNLLRGDSFSGINMRKTHCIRGHELSGDNLYIHKRKNGYIRRQCKTCRKEAVVRHIIQSCK